MKKTFILNHPKKKYPRLIESAKNDIRKYIRRERKKELPEGMDYWDFSCKFGSEEANAETIHLSAIDEQINKIEENGEEQFFVEVIAEAKQRLGKNEPKAPSSKPGWKSAKEE